jgi:hypothetical protein
MKLEQFGANKPKTFDQYHLRQNAAGRLQRVTSLHPAP